LLDASSSIPPAHALVFQFTLPLMFTKEHQQKLSTNGTEPV